MKIRAMQLKDMEEVVGMMRVFYDSPAVIHVAPDRAELVETRIIDGRKCLVIPMESEIELNGIRVSTLNSVENTSAEPLPVNDITDIDNSNIEEEIPF